jgi:signal transduction histidine kinase
MIEELSSFPLFQEVPEEEITWFWEHSQSEKLDSGDYFFEENTPADCFYVVLEGEMQITRTVNGRETVLGTNPPGVMGGELSLLYGSNSDISSRAIMPTSLRALDARAFRELFAACPTIGARIFQTAIERTQGFVSSVSQQEKLAALGKLSAGLAHEMNNPASAARRAVEALSQTLPTLEAQIIKLNGLNLSEVQLEKLLQFQQTAVVFAGQSGFHDPVEQSDRETEFAEWLEGLEVFDGWELAPAFVSAGIRLESIRSLFAGLPQGSAPEIISWLHASLETQALLNDIEQSTRRISDLVQAVKEYTYMDQSALQEVDIHRGLESTLKVMGHKLKNIQVTREYDPHLPKIMGKGGELNQVWTNLIDNAIDAMDGEGKLTLTTRCENNYVMVEIADSGKGIASDHLPRLFEPFFTTKQVGQGTGLGLDISYRVIQSHHGTIETQSKPGHTRFIVRLPVGRDGDPGEATDEAEAASAS